MAKQLLLILSTLGTLLFANPSATYVGDKVCAECHSQEVKEWKGSHHDLAMMEANESSVKGDFNNATLNYNGIVTTFFKKGSKFMVNTDGPDAKLHDYEISYTFGVYPLQQYMIKFPKGKVQVLDIAWDSRKKVEGGQRWYHIHADDNVTSDDVLHWTGPNLNWNYMCADCHSTNLKKNYDSETKSYHTTWDSINVSCEACHGPASTHMKWTKNKELNVTNSGFPLSLLKRKKTWDTHTKTLKSELRNTQMNVCAKCHSRRSQLDDNYTAGDDFNEHYLSFGLEENLYFPDGKIQDEVYVYNSFLQSKMYAAGVTCTDCHNPHTLKRKAEGDKVCFTCHAPEKYTSSSHHFHKDKSTGSSCIACHMPARTYMGVDKRNDHSFRVPRPDVSVNMKEVPNACNLCHKDQNASWAADAVKKWYGKVPKGKQNFAHSLQALRTNSKYAQKSLYEILRGDAPKIAKATATSYLGSFPSRQTYMTTRQMLINSNPSIRRAALRALEAFPPKMKTKELLKSLNDPIKIVRMEASRQLASLPQESFDSNQTKTLKKSFDEYEQILLFTAERPESQLSLGNFYAGRAMPTKAQKAYEEALRLQKKYIPAYINYSNFLGSQGKSTQAFEILKKGINEVPNIAILHHALGLWYVLNKEKEKAIVSFEQAVELDKEDARFSYVYAVSIGEKNPKKAIEILEEVYPKHTGDMQVISGLVYYTKQVGDTEKSKLYEKKIPDLQNISVNQK